MSVGNKCSVLNIFIRCTKIFRHTRESPVWSTLDAIQHIAVDPNQETVVITTLRKQLYYVKLFGQHMLQVSEIFGMSASQVKYVS